MQNTVADEMIFIMDGVGRGWCDQDRLSNLDCIAENKLPWLVTHEQEWAPTNGVARHAMRVARHDWVMISHEDMLWPHFDYSSRIRKAIDFVEKGDKIIAGIEFGVFEARAGVQREYPLFSGQVGTTDLLIAHTAVLSRKVYEEVGGISLTDYIWWNGAYQEEMRRRALRFLYVRWPAPYHLGAQSFAASDYATAFEKAPAWRDYAGNFERKYGKKSHNIPMTPLLPWPEAEFLLE
jgi:hypothetical protein